MRKLETAIFGGGCFWCTEAIFKSLKGVIEVVSGYAGGNTPDPSYSQVVSESTNHAEVIKIKFDPEIISYDTLLDVFWNTHNPTTPDRQGNDIGNSYRSVIFYTDSKQMITIRRSLKKLKDEHIYQDPIVTEIKPLDKFYRAEDYHQDYYNKYHDEPYCRIVISPKLRHLREKYARLIK